MKYKVGEKVMIRTDLKEGMSIPFSVNENMANLAGRIVEIESVEGLCGVFPDMYKIKGDPHGWHEDMFEPVPQFSSGIISLSNDPRLSDIKKYPILEQIDSETIKITDCFNKETRYRWDGCKWNEVRDTPTSGKSVFKPMISALEKCIRLAVESEFGTKKSTGIESRKDIRKRLLKL